MVLAFYSKSRCSFFPFYILRSTNFKTYIKGSPQILLMPPTVKSLFWTPRIQHGPSLLWFLYLKNNDNNKGKEEEKEVEQKKDSRQQTKKIGRKEGKDAEVRLHWDWGSALGQALRGSFSLVTHLTWTTPVLWKLIIICSFQKRTPIREIKCLA